MLNAHPEDAKKDAKNAIKNDIKTMAAAYNIEVVGFLNLDDTTTIPSGEMNLLKGVKWADTEVNTSNIQDPVDIMPSAKTLVILGKRLMDDSQDVYYQISENYVESVEMMVLDIAVARIKEHLKDNSLEAMEYTSYYLKAWAVMAGLGWIGKSRLFISKEHGPRLRLRGILTDIALGDSSAEILSDDNCGQCTECARACPAGAIGSNGVNRKKCGACALNHRKISEKAYAYCTACTSSCPVGMKHKVGTHVHGDQAISKQRITP
jgi:epoxyqueuosine reductase